MGNVTLITIRSIGKKARMTETKEKDTMEDNEIEGLLMALSKLIMIWFDNENEKSYDC